MQFMTKNLYYICMKNINCNKIIHNIVSLSIENPKRFNFYVNASRGITSITLSILELLHIMYTLIRHIWKSNIYGCANFNFLIFNFHCHCYHTKQCQYWQKKIMKKIINYANNHDAQWSHDIISFLLQETTLWWATSTLVRKTQNNYLNINS